MSLLDELGFFVPGSGTYVRRVFDREYEIGALTGNFSELEGRPFPHCHVVLGDEPGSPLRLDIGRARRRITELGQGNPRGRAHPRLGRAPQAEDAGQFDQSGDRRDHPDAGDAAAR